MAFSVWIKKKNFHENYKKRTVNIEFSEGYNVLG